MASLFLIRAGVLTSVNHRVARHGGVPAGKPASPARPRGHGLHALRIAAVAVESLLLKVCYLGVYWR